MKINIVEYEHKYAEATAEMWLNSAKGWMGQTFFANAEDVKNDEENSIHLKAWLALDGKRVVGYCNIYEYQEDTGALYIGLLNVRDDYHGKKIGKELVLNAVDKTIELGWDRLDLYTWSGNTKAVPLYKKTGFFWEDRDDSTHLVNFIPSIVKNEMLIDYFKDIDWYKDSTRKIEVVPDGRKENKFEYYQYSWEKGDTKLIAEYCRRGRGLRKIETDEFSITATVENLKLVFGNSYKIRYEILNKTAKPLDVQFKGFTDKNIEFAIEKKLTVKKSKTFEADFMVNHIGKEQNEWKTHPCVAADVTVNGKTAQFKVGVEPQFPAKINLTRKNDLCYSGVETELILEMANNFKETTKYSFELNDSEDLKFRQNSYEIELKSDEKRSINISAVIEKGHVYNHDLEVTAQRVGFEPLKFKRKICSFFQTLTDRFYGSGINHHFMANGSINLYLQFKDFYNNFSLGNIMDNNRVNFSYPKLGKPFCDEFNRKPCDKVEYEERGTSIIQRAFFTSDKYEGINFQIIHEIYSQGLIKHWFEFKNIGYKDVEELVLKDNFGLGFQHLELPYEGKKLLIEDDVSGGVGNWDASKLSENWMFGKNRESTIGVCWDKDYKVQFGAWEKFFQHDLSSLKIGEKIVTKPLIIAFDMFKDSESFRQFALGKQVDELPAHRDLLFEINGGNPFVSEKFPVKVIELKKVNQEGLVKLSTPQKSTLLGKFNEKKPVRELQTDVAWNEGKLNNILTLNTELNALEKEKKRVVFGRNNQQINSEIVELDGKKVHQVSSDLLSISASAEFAPSLFSLKLKGQDWLDSSFPTPGPKSWWKPWIGGIYTTPERIAMNSILKEKYKVDFVKKSDNFGNQWEGISIRMEIEKAEKFKGLIFEQLFLIQAGVPVMLHTTRIEQNTGRLFRYEPFETGHFINPEADIKDCTYISENRVGERMQHKAGIRAQDYSPKSRIVFSGENQSDYLQVYIPDRKTWKWLCPDLFVMNAWIGDNITSEAGEERYLPNRFYIFTDQILEDEMMQDLKNIKFEI